jgi:hypothetical protein
VHLGLDQFLKQLREFAELVLFTAGLKGLIITVYLVFILVLLAIISSLFIDNFSVSLIFNICRLCQPNHLLTE